MPPPARLMVRSTRLPLLLLAAITLLSGCGASTGIPGHGGGKRFAIEQELVAAATRAAIKKIDLARIRESKVNLFINAIGDTGAGNLTGGRFSIVSQVRGDYIQTAPVTETSVYPRYQATSSTASLSDPSITGTTHTTSSLLAAPITRQTRQEGGARTVQAGVEYNGLGAYHNSEEITANDLNYLAALMQTYLFLQGVFVVPPSEAEVDLYITVDVFGTVYTRVDWLLANNEILRAKTTLEVLAVDHWSGALLMPPQSASAESEYNEQYLLWAGPISITKSLRNSDPLLTDFTDVQHKAPPSLPIIRNMTPPYPFRN